MAANQLLSLFISSKMVELATERRSVETALSQYRMLGWLWEDDAGARSESVRSTYLTEVEACDIYIGLFWLGYGPYTLEEFNHARLHHKPCLIYEKKVDMSKRSLQLQTFLDDIRRVDNPEGLTVYSFMTPEVLVEQVQKDVMRLLVTVFRDSRQQPPMQAFSPNLSFKEKFALVEKLLACSSLRSKETRETIIKQLSDQITDKIERRSTVRGDIMSIVDTCLEYPGGLEEFIIIVRFFEGNSIPMQHLDHFLKSISRSV